MCGIRDRPEACRLPTSVLDSPLQMGTLTDDIAGAIAELRQGRVEFKMDRTGIVHAPIGKAAFDPQALFLNMGALTGVHTYFCTAHALHTAVQRDLNCSGCCMPLGCYPAHPSCCKSCAASCTTIQRFHKAQVAPLISTAYTLCSMYVPCRCPAFSEA